MYSQHYTPEDLRARLSYNPDTGDLIWKKCHDSSRIGKKAESKDICGYIQINIGGKVLKAHRVAWAIHYGDWPSGQVDHKNGIRNDNRISNLRCVDNQKNCQNQRNGSRKNATGLIGVHVGKGRPEKKYRAKIQLNGKQIHIGGYSTPQEAHEAYVKAKREMHEGNLL